MANKVTTPITFYLFLLTVGTTLTVGLALPNAPATLAQEPPTATPDAQGIIYVIVQPQDSLWAIAGRTGVPFADLLALNGLTENALIQPGDLLIIGFGPSPTPEIIPPTPTPTRPPPTVTATSEPRPPTGICLTAFDDRNQNGKHEDHEPLKAAVAFTIFNEAVVVANYVTDGRSEPHCFTELKAGNYKVTRSYRPDETLTTPGDGLITLGWGTMAELAFGSYIGPSLTTNTPRPITIPTTVVTTTSPTPIPITTSDTTLNTNVPAQPTVEADGRLPMPLIIILLVAGLLLLAVLTLRRRNTEA